MHINRPFYVLKTNTLQANEEVYVSERLPPSFMEASQSFLSQTYQSLDDDTPLNDQQFDILRTQILSIVRMENGAGKDDVMEIIEHDLAVAHQIGKLTLKQKQECLMLLNRTIFADS